MNQYGKHVKKQMDTYMSNPDSIDEEISDIQNATHGVEVRGALAAGVRKSFDKSVEAEATSENAQEQVNNIQSQVDQLVIEGDSSVEAAQARVDSKGNTYSTLKERLDDKETEFSSQLADTATKEELNTVADEKADKGALAQVAQSKRDKDVEIGMADLDQEVREAFTGGSTPVVGENSVGKENLKDNAVTNEKMDKNYNVKGIYREEADLNYVWEEGNYLINGSQNSPIDTTSTLVVERFKTDVVSSSLVWLRQTISLAVSESTRKEPLMYVRELQYNENTSSVTFVRPWRKMSGKIDNKRLDKNYAFADYLSDDTYDLDLAIFEGNYMVNNAVKNNPFGIGCTMKVTRHKVGLDIDTLWVIQDCTVYGKVKMRGKRAWRVISYNEGTDTITYISDWQGDYQEPLKVLFVSNSFGYNVTEYIHRICEAEDKNILVGNLYISGGALESHAENLTNNSDVYQYRIRSYINGVTEATTKENYTIDDGINEEDWDIIIFNQSSGNSGVYSTFQPYLNDLISHVKNKLPNAKIGLMPTWAYFSDFANPELNLSHQGRFDKYNNDQMTMYEMIMEAYNVAMEDVDFDLIIPAGTAIQNARTNGYMNGLEYELTRDGYHLNNTGMFIAGLTLYQSLFKSVVKSHYTPPGVTKKGAFYSRVASDNAVLNPFKLTNIN